MNKHLGGNVGHNTEPVHKFLEHHQTTHKVMPVNAQGNIKYCKNVSMFS